LKKNKLRNYIVSTHAEFFRAGMEGQLDEGDGRILLGDNSSGGAVMLRPITFQYVGDST